PAPDPAASSNFAAAAMVAAQKLQQYIAEAEAQGL
ncbi:MAG: hypothetical protein ACJAXW_003383, partial [Candidatus Azotimanducaceae bacterium]